MKRPVRYSSISNPRKLREKKISQVNSRCSKNELKCDRQKNLRKLSKNGAWTHEILTRRVFSLWKCRISGDNLLSRLIKCLRRWDKKTENSWRLYRSSELLQKVRKTILNPSGLPAPSYRTIKIVRFLHRVSFFWKRKTPVFNIVVGLERTQIFVQFRLAKIKRMKLENENFGFLITEDIF